MLIVRPETPRGLACLLILNNPFSRIFLRGTSPKNFFGGLLRSSSVQRVFSEECSFLSST